MHPTFIKVRKDNKTRDRGFIAVDAICSVFENKDSQNVSIMTMDGFWYDVDDDVDTLYALISGDDAKISCKSQGLLANPKKEYFRRKKMMQPAVANEKPVVNHEVIRRNIDESRQTKEVGCEDIFKPVMRKGKSVKPYSPKIRINSDLSAGADEGQYEPKPIGGGL